MEVERGGTYVYPYNYLRNVEEETLTTQKTGGINLPARRKLINQVSMRTGEWINYIYIYSVHPNLAKHHLLPLLG